MLTNKTNLMKRIALIFLSVISVTSLYGRKVVLNPSVPVEKQLVYPNTTYVVKSAIDCKGIELKIPSNCTLKIISGSLCNGTLVGNGTKLKNSAEKSLAVVVKGSWCAPLIKDSYFDTTVLTDDQIIGNINALQSDDIKNTIIICAKDYNCSITKSSRSVLILRSRTKCTLKSTLSILPCEHPNYQIVQICDVHDVELYGGMIVGDLLEHLYTLGSSHEWGHGITIKNAQRVKVSSVYVTRCIGDGIVIGGWQEPNTNVYEKAAKQVFLENIISDDNRRQGLTISHADGVVVKNCRLTNTGMTKYTAPSAGLDIEPNAEEPWNQGVKNVLIKNCFFSGNKHRQFLSHGYFNSGEEDNIQNIIVQGCTFEGNCDVHTGGITFISSTMESVTFCGGRDKISSTTFNGCVFTGYNPLIFEGSMSKDGSGKTIGGVFETIKLKRCEIHSRESKEAIFSLSPSAGGKVINLIFDSCKIVCNDETADRAIVSEQFNGRVTEINTKRILQK